MSRYTFPFAENPDESSSPEAEVPNQNVVSNSGAVDAPLLHPSRSPTRPKFVYGPEHWGTGYRTPMKSTVGGDERFNPDLVPPASTPANEGETSAADTDTPEDDLTNNHETDESSPPEEPLRDKTSRSCTDDEEQSESEEQEDSEDDVSDYTGQSSTSSATSSETESSSSDDESSSSDEEGSGDDWVVTNHSSRLNPTFIPSSETGDEHTIGGSYSSSEDSEDTEHSHQRFFGERHRDANAEFARHYLQPLREVNIDTFTQLLDSMISSNEAVATAAGAKTGNVTQAGTALTRQRKESPTITFSYANVGTVKRKVTSRGLKYSVKVKDDDEGARKQAKFLANLMRKECRNIRADQNDARINLSNIPASKRDIFREEYERAGFENFTSPVLDFDIANDDNDSAMGMGMGLRALD